MIITLASIGLWVCIAVLAIYTLRHYFFTLNRLFGRHRQPYVDIVQADWPSMTVFVPAHNEGRVIRDSLDALLSVDYPADKLRIVPIDDRSIDDTRPIMQEYASIYPDRIFPFLRDGGTPGKAAALAEAMALYDGDIFMVFDADYIPGPRLLKQLSAPFFRRGSRRCDGARCTAQRGQVVAHAFVGFRARRWLSGGSASAHELAAHSTVRRHRWWRAPCGT